MKNRVNQSGFGNVEILLVVLVFVLTIISGYFVYARNNKKDTGSNTNQSSSTEDKIASTKKRGT